ncbi:hypothetical protein AG1IA_08070 [Rhizoctonia solani AG-1 IA]|uniref:Uncharacterized protein n=1 Tax=Thanatephorus cucumeris (strain AG1-IA) TaxID=983506 RepID=L8WM63_THACA|nr:hypothetical protein AG1IA_08070 [Rhizoctonia solani AG-1 IA]
MVNPPSKSPKFALVFRIRARYGRGATRAKGMSNNWKEFAQIHPVRNAKLNNRPLKENFCAGRSVIGIAWRSSCAGISKHSYGHRSQ